MNKHNIFDYDAVMNIASTRVQAAFATCSLSFPEISVISGYSHAQLQKFRDGNLNGLPMQGLWQLAKALAVSPYWLLGAPHNTKNAYVEDISPRRVAFVGDIIEKVSETFKVHRRDILGRAKFDFILPARFALCKILHDRGMSHSSIGKMMDRDHSTIIHAVKRAEQIMQENKAYADIINEIISTQLEPVKLRETSNG